MVYSEGYLEKFKASDLLCLKKDEISTKNNFKNPGVWLKKLELHQKNFLMCTKNDLGASDAKIVITGALKTVVSKHALECRKNYKNKIPKTVRNIDNDSVDDLVIKALTNYYNDEYADDEWIMLEEEYEKFKKDFEKNQNTTKFPDMFDDFWSGLTDIWFK